MFLDFCFLESVIRNMFLNFVLHNVLFVFYICLFRKRFWFSNSSIICILFSNSIQIFHFSNTKNLFWIFFFGIYFSFQISNSRIKDDYEISEIKRVHVRIYWLHEAKACSISFQFPSEKLYSLIVDENDFFKTFSFKLKQVRREIVLLIKDLFT